MKRTGEAATGTAELEGQLGETHRLLAETARTAKEQEGQLWKRGGRWSPDHGLHATDALMEPVAQTASTHAPFSRKGFKAATRGASSHFVGSAIVILSSYTVATLAMYCGKKIQERKLKANPR